MAPDIARFISAGKPRPAPAPSRTIGGTRSGAKLPSTGVLANSSKPTPISTRLGISVARGPKRITRRSETRSDIAPMTIVAGRKARPTSSGS